MGDWAVYELSDLMMAVPSDGVNIRWETFPAVLFGCPEDKDKVAVYYDGGVLLVCKRIDGRWQVNMSLYTK